ncbi:NAD(P)H-dependent D-xylose reductase [Diaporthe helianthi]|uniref:NAD(P)H-dependent D-xylose reductase n=1 Tax=Diaporthe helianthi TaxID=158607 RepID=A0A2P5I4N6_DIAHE|nr:NAD(P)H-dependent D-xylose reductase [Diaporthe helianthi]
MPITGLSIWKVPREETANASYEAIKLGYRLIDGAHKYGNSREASEGIRRAMAEGLVRREDLFVTSKLWNTSNIITKVHGSKGDRSADILVRLGGKTCLPAGKGAPGRDVVYFETMVKTKENPDGIIKSLGVANFHAQLLYDLLSYAKVPVAAT